MSLSPTSHSVEHLVSFERALTGVRWFGIALGLWQVLDYVPDRLTTQVPPSMRGISLSALAFLALINVLVTVTLRRHGNDLRVLHRLGFTVFAGDLAALWAITWAFNFEEFGSTWIIVLVSTLEGAQRYQLRGALTPVVLAAPIELVREYVRTETYGFRFYTTGVTFRIGFMFIIGYVAGVMARNMVRQGAEAERRAHENEQLAAREADARHESNAFQQVILAGVSAGGLTDALQSMIEHIAEALGYRSLAVLMVGKDGRLRPAVARGFSQSVLDESVALGEGISGFVALSGTTEIVPDVSLDRRYVCVDPATRSQIAVPIQSDGRVIGVLDVESPELGAFTAADASRLERLGEQMALVIENSRLLSKERATTERLRDLDVMKSDFIAIASHELRTPLTAMTGSIKTLLRSGHALQPGNRMELLQMLDRQTDRLTRLVEDILLASRIDAGAISLRIETVDVREMLAEMLHEVGPRAARVSLALSDEMPRVTSDGGRLGQIARNLVENALKFAPEDTTVRLAAHLDHDGLLIEVSDDGPGIAADELPRLFERFHQTGGALRRRSDHGFGLGLYITKRLVEALRGTIEVDSTVGRGSTFRVRIPAQLARDEASDIA